MSQQLLILSITIFESQLFEICFVSSFVLKKWFIYCLDTDIKYLRVFFANLS